MSKKILHVKGGDELELQYPKTTPINSYQNYNTQLSPNNNYSYFILIVARFVNRIMYFGKYVWAAVGSTIVRVDPKTRYYHNTTSHIAPFGPLTFCLYGIFFWSSPFIYISRGARSRRNLPNSSSTYANCNFVGAC